MRGAERKRSREREKRKAIRDWGREGREGKSVGRRDRGEREKGREGEIGRERGWREGQR